MNVSVIIVAAGSGKRMKSAIAKQYLDLNGRSILSYTVEVFEESPVVNEIILVTGKDEIEYVKSEIIDILKGVMEFPLAKNAADKTGFKKVKIRPELTIKR